ncbi:MAG TPA: hypothetical protein VN692_21920 [Steroidobacteraceae bacterium]|nr:hypothetical protein [Steroidobacteraceae bacterium]
MKSRRGPWFLARPCRELEDAARAGELAAAREIFSRITTLHARARDELQFVMRRSA